MLETDRLILRPVEDSDLDDLFNNWSSDLITTKYLTFRSNSYLKETNWKIYRKVLKKIMWK